VSSLTNYKAIIRWGGHRKRICAEEGVGPVTEQLEQLAAATEMGTGDSWASGRTYPQ